MALETAQTLDDFLAGVERRAYRMAFVATGHRDDALDIVQDAMMKLVKKYANRNASEWGPLFHRITQSTIRDWYRRQKVRNQWRTLLEYTRVGARQHFASDAGEGYAEQAGVNIVDQFEDVHGQGPAMCLVNEKTIEALDRALHGLPLRQQQAFLLRVWEGLNVEETADAMGCSQGSVKTHFSRAIHTLRKQIEEYRG
ncbi:MAG: RNA polymerase sigma factor [Gammaproteobacteria bacterium]|nr:RNA polymerase sigma factor [Gammaproteobacteria bacterium]